MAAVVRAFDSSRPCRAPFLVSLLILAVWGRCPELESAAQSADKKGAPTSGEDKAADIGILTVTEFHQRLEDVCVNPGLQVYYNGPLARPRGVGGVLAEGKSDRALSWNVVYTKKTRSAL